MTLCVFIFISASVFIFLLVGVVCGVMNQEDINKEIDKMTTARINKKCKYCGTVIGLRRYCSKCGWRELETVL